ncbi:MAG: hypothetical protein QXE31_03475 [Candidatus Woesearchaeota archaeon]
MTEKYYWQRVLGDEKLKLDLKKLKETSFEVFKNESDNYKQKLVYNLLEYVKNNDQKRFFYILLKSINKPKEDFLILIKKLEDYYDVMPESVFINFAYSIILGIMSSYTGGVKNE